MSALLLYKVPVVSPSLTVNARPLNNWPALLGFTSKLIKLMLRVPLFGMNLAEAFTGPSGTLAPVGVTQSVSPQAAPVIVKKAGINKYRVIRFIELLTL
jgi:hypothetical protein